RAASVTRPLRGRILIWARILTGGQRRLPDAAGTFAIGLRTRRGRCRWTTAGRRAPAGGEASKHDDRDEPMSHKMFTFLHGSPTVPLMGVQVSCLRLCVAPARKVGLGQPGKSQ